MRDFLRIEEARSGARFAAPETRPGIFYRLFGAGELMVTLEYLAGPAKIEVFQQPLASTITGILCPDVRERLTRHRAHVLVNVSHGVMGGVASQPRIAGFLQQIGIRPEGHSLPEFKRRLDVLGLLSRLVCEHAPPSLVHWTQSNQLIPGELFDAFAAAAAPSELHVHPYLFGGAGKVGIRTFGARHFIGREVLVEPHVLPWAANFQAVIAFLKVATIDNGYIIPDGNTFGPEDGSLSYRALHRPAAEGDAPLIELVPLMHREHGFQSDDYVPRHRVIDDRAPPPSLMPAGQHEKQELANEWREKRALAEGIGGRFEVRAKGDAPLPVPPPTDDAPRLQLGRRAVFGRKGMS